MYIVSIGRNIKSKLSHMEETRIAKTSKTTNQQKHWKRWEDLDTDILKNILSRIHPDDLFWKTSFVCCSWRSAALNFLFWSRSSNVLDFDFAMAAFNDLSSVKPPNLVRLYSCPGYPGKYPSPREYDQMAGRLTKLLKHIMEDSNDAYGHSLGQWTRSINTIIIPYDLELSDEHLLFIAQRSPGVKYLTLLGTHKLTAEGFAKVIRRWKFLKSIHLGPIKYKRWYSDMMQEIGQNCKQVEELYIHHAEVMISKFKPLAMDIVRNLPGLKKVGFEAALIPRTGLSILLYLFPQLQEITVSECTLSFELFNDSFDRLYCGKWSFGLERKRTTDDDYSERVQWRVKDYCSPTKSMFSVVRFIENIQIFYELFLYLED